MVREGWKKKRMDVEEESRGAFTTDTKYIFNSLKNLRYLFDYRNYICVDLMPGTITNEWFIENYVESSGRNSYRKEFVYYNDLTFNAISNIKNYPNSDRITGLLVPVIYLKNYRVKQSKFIKFMKLLLRNVRRKSRSEVGNGIVVFDRILLIFDDRETKRMKLTGRSKTIKDYFDSKNVRIVELVKSVFKKIRIDNFSIDELNIYSNQMMNCFPHDNSRLKVIILNSDQISNLKGVYGDLKERFTRLPKVFSDDYQCRFVGARAGNILKFTTPSQTAGFNTRYRLVIDEKR